MLLYLENYLVQLIFQASFEVYNLRGFCLNMYVIAQYYDWSSSNQVNETCNFFNLAK